MNRLTKTSWLLMAMTLLTLAACGGSAPAAPTADTGPVFTQIAGTAVALQTQVAQVAMTQTSISAPTATAPVIPTLESTPTPPATPTPVPPLPTSLPTATKVIVFATPNTTLSANTGPVPTMNVTLLTNDVQTYTSTIIAGQSLILRARVENTSDIPLQVVANLTVPDGWDVDQDKYSDCPTDNSFDRHEVCTISWYFTPQVSGQVYLRVYVRGIYTDINGNTQRITDSPSFFFIVQPAKS